MLLYCSHVEVSPLLDCGWTLLRPHPQGMRKQAIALAEPSESRDVSAQWLLTSSQRTSSLVQLSEWSCHA
jgi:hypothetical protein